jgi:DNA-directed RNA polymerase subunit F
MLRIVVSPDGPAKIDFSNFRNYLLPLPEDGVDAENERLVLLFDDEKQAIDYARQLSKLPGSQRKVSNELVAAIGNDKFVRAFAQAC